MAESMLLKAILQFDAAKAIQDMGRASIAFERMHGATNRVMGGATAVASSMGRLALSASPVAFGLGMAINSSREFGKAIAFIQTIADPAELSQRKLEDSTLALAMAYGTAPVDQAMSMYQAISSGATTAAQALAIMDTSNRLAVAGGAQLEPTLKLMGTIMNTYGQQGLSAAEASDILFQSTNYGVMTIAELGASMGDVVPTAAALNISFTDINAAMATATLRGATASEAATGLNMALVNVLKPTKDAKDMAKMLGLEFNAAALKTKGLNGFMQDVVKKTKGSEEAMTSLFGSIMGFKTVMKLTAEEGKLYNEILGKVGEHANATDGAFEKMSNTLDFQMRKMNALRQVAQTLFGQVLEGALLRLSAPLAGVAEGFVNILQAVKTGEFTGLSDSAVAMAQGIRDGLDAVVGGVDWLVASLGRAKKWMTDTFGEDSLRSISKWGVIFAVAAAAIIPVGAILLGFGFVISSIVTLIGGLGSVLFGVFTLMTGPIGIIIALVVLFREELYQVFLGLMDVVGPIFQELYRIFSSTFDKISQIFGNISKMWADSTGGMSTDWRAVGQVIGVVVGAILIVISKLISGVAIFLADATQGFVGFGLSLGKTFAAVYLWVMSTATKIAGGIVKLMAATGMKQSEGLVSFSKETYNQPTARSTENTYVNSINAAGTNDAKNKASATGEAKESRGALAAVMDEIREASKNSAIAAKSAEAAAKNKAAVHVNVDGREVARANSKAQADIQVRTGEKLTPWQRNRIVVSGAQSVR
jgi:TP901 family phage tail tape measure protein